MFLGIALDAPFPKTNVERRYKASGGRRNVASIGRTAVVKMKIKIPQSKKSLSILWYKHLVVQPLS